MVAGPVREPAVEPDADAVAGAESAEREGYEPPRASAVDEEAGEHQYLPLSERRARSSSSCSRRQWRRWARSRRTPPRSTDRSTGAVVDREKTSLNSSHT